MILEDDPAEKWLNDYGLRKWKHKRIEFITAERAYHWKDRVIIIDNSTGRKKYMYEVSFSKFINNVSDWEELTE